MLKPYLLTIRVEREVEVSVEANSPEEAESIGESLVYEDDSGFRELSKEVTVLEILPVELGYLGEPEVVEDE